MFAEGCTGQGHANRGFLGLRQCLILPRARRLRHPALGESAM